MHAKEHLSHVLPVQRATPQHWCSITHFRFVSAAQVQRLWEWEVPRRVRPDATSGSISIMMAETAEELGKRPEIRKELERATGQKHQERVETGDRDKFWFVIHAIILAICAAIYFLIGAKIIPLPSAAVGIAERILRGAALITIALAIARAVSVYGLARIEDAATRFTLQRIAHLVTALAVAVIVISIIFVNWYAAIAAFGV